MIVIIDYGMGNLHSVWKAFKRLGFEAKISSKQKDIENADKLILPGVGHFKRGMQNIKDLNLIDALNQKVLVEKTPVLGICLGMQLFTRHSEEGDAEGLGWFDAKTIRFNIEKEFHNLRVPHMGGNTINLSADDGFLFKGIGKDATFYFVHSYYVVCENPKDIFATSTYGIDFVSAIHKENIYGVQFHPEKSHNDGLHILKNFAHFHHHQKSVFS